MQKKDFNFSMQNRPRLRLQALTCVGGRGSGCQCHQLTTLLLNLCRSPAADKEVNYHMLKWQCDQQACKQSLPRERSDAPPDGEPGPSIVPGEGWRQGVSLGLL